MCGPIRKLSFAAAGMLAAVFLLVGPSAATAAPPSPVAIDLFPSQFCCPEIGTWQASGAINDSGTYVRTGHHETGSIPDCFCNFEHNGVFTEEFLLTGSQGTLTLKAEQQVLPTRGFEGPWQVESGTGAYAGASGHGTDQFFVPTLTLSMTGVISKAD